MLGMALVHDYAASAYSSSYGRKWKFGNENMEMKGKTMSTNSAFNGNQHQNSRVCRDERLFFS